MTGGISGIFHYGRAGRKAEPRALHAMCSETTGGGVMTATTWVEGPAALAVVRPEGDARSTSGCHFSKASPVKAVFMGEIAGAAELEAMAGVSAANPAELAAALYRTHGDSFADLINGSFAVAIFDPERSTLVVATDRFSVIPVYYSDSGRTVVFSTDPRAVSRSTLGSSPDISAESIYHYLNFFYIPHPHTIFDGIKKLEPGCMLTSIDGSTTVRRYFELDYTADAGHGEDYYVEKLRTVITDSVRDAAAGAAPEGRVGTFLSGGTDSSTVTGLLASGTDAPVKSFSIGFSEDAYNELEYARLAARHFNTEHFEYIVKPSDVADAIPLLTSAYHEPFGNSSAVATYYCARLAHDNGVDVLLAGDGGDEIFGGNERYLKNKYFGIYHSLPGALRKGVIDTVVKAMPGRSFFMNRVRNFTRRGNLANPERHYTDDSFASDFFTEFFEDAFRARLDQWASLHHMEEIYAGAHATGELNRLMYLDLMTAIAGSDLVKVTGACDSGGVRVRFPLLDHRLVEFTASMPEKMKLKGREKRYLFKRFIKGFVPDEIITKTKHGFGVPVGVWVRTEPAIRDLARELLLSEKTVGRGYFREEFLSRLFDSHIRGEWNYDNEIWALMMLELWLREYVDR